MFFLPIVLMSLSTLETSPILKDSVDLIEYNEYYSINSEIDSTVFGGVRIEIKLVLSQVIYWDWSNVDNTWRVVDFKLMEDPHIIKTKDGYSLRYIDNKRIREVHSKQYRETKTEYDPELIDRNYLPKEYRRLLKESHNKEVPPMVVEDLT